jgi:four helix bundle protein
MDKNDEIRSHKDLILWQKGIELAVRLYELTRLFPKEENYGITSQMRRAAISIPSNVAEGRNRGSKKEFIHFLRISLGSAAELETQLVICKEIFKNKKYDYTPVNDLLIEVMKITKKMIGSLNV